MGDTRHELTDGRQLLGLDELRLRRFQLIHCRNEPAIRAGQLARHALEPARTKDFLRHIPGHLHDGRPGGGKAHWKARDVEDRAVRQGDLTPGRAGGHLPAGTTITGVSPGAEADIPAGCAPQRRDGQREVLGERPIAHQQLAAAVEHRDEIAHHIEDLLPLVLPVPYRLMQPGVLDRHDNLTGDRREQALVCRVEARGGASSK